MLPPAAVKLRMSLLILLSSRMSPQNPSSAVRAVIHLSPAVYVAGIVTAQRAGLSYSEFLDSAITKACAGSEGEKAIAPWSPAAMELFLSVADAAPNLLAGAWRVLYSKVLTEETLWEAPRATLGEVDSFLGTDGWRIDELKLRKAWPRLVSETFCT